MITEDSTLPMIVQHCFTTYRTSGAFFYRRGDGFSPLSSEYILETIRRLALGLRACGLKKGDVVMVIAPSSPWWLMVDQAIMLAGGRSCAVFPKISKKNLLYQIKNSDSRFAYIDSPDLWKIAQEGCTHLKKVILRDVAHQHRNNIALFDDVLKQGDLLSLKSPTLHNQMFDEIDPDDIATLIYTSGSTGVPKGVALSHRNLCSQIASAIQLFPLEHSSDRALSALPLAHSFERVVVYTYFCQGVSVYFADDIQKLKEYLPEVQPTVMSMVPRILEKLYANLQIRVRESNPLRRLLGEWGFKVAHNDCANLFSKVILDYLLFRKIRAGMGGKLKAVIVGGAALEERLCRFFINIGIPVYQGYGLTETSPVITVNYPGHNTPGTVGPPFPGVKVAIRGSDGEIRCKGPNIMEGYHRLADLTAQRYDSEGWFCTGDCGEFDAQGNLIITGRLTEMFKTSTGKFVTPVPIEQSLVKHPLIDAAMIIADGKSYVTALLFAETEVLQTTLERYSHSKECASKQDADYLIIKTLQTHIDTVNQELNGWERIRSFRFITDELTIESGMLTPTMKLCRGVVNEQYNALINAMYGEQNEPSDKERG